MHPRSAASNFIRPLVISGPSGTGKSTLLKRLFVEFPNAFAFSVSHTTRKPRTGERDGSNYHFVSRERFMEFKQNGAFLETAEFSGNLYGTSFDSVESCRRTGRICVLDLELQGCRSLKDHPTFNAHFLFLAPPSIQILEQRIRQRNTETDESIRLRLESAKRDIEAARMEVDMFERFMVNDDLDRTYNELVDLLKSWYGGVYYL